MTKNTGGRIVSKKNYKISYVGIVEGYEISITDEDTDDYEIFSTFREAKFEAVQKAKSDVEGAKRGLRMTRSIKKGEVS